MKFLILLLLTLTPLEAKELKISVKVTPTICLAPCTVRVELVIPQQEDNRWAVVEVSGDMFRSTQVQLDGLSAPKRFTFTYKDLPEDNYDVKGMLYNSVREIGRSQQTLIVKGF